MCDVSESIPNSISKDACSGFQSMRSEHESCFEKKEMIFRLTCASIQSAAFVIALTNVSTSSERPSEETKCPPFRPIFIS